MRRSTKIGVLAFMGGTIGLSLLLVDVPPIMLVMMLSMASLGAYMIVRLPGVSQDSPPRAGQNTILQPC